jgi:hypothetical protein
LFSVYSIKTCYMSVSEVLLDYHGPVDLKVIELLLKKLRGKEEYKGLNITARKRVYAIIVECLENIYKNPIEPSSPDLLIQSRISAITENDKIYIVAGNPVSDNIKDSLARKIDHVNRLDNEDLKTLHENRINRESVKGENGAGLGLIYMVLKSGNKIDYIFQPLSGGYSYFEMKITLNKYIMRKLIIDKTPSTPKVILDPEKKIYLISGESRPPDVREFYDQIISWMEEFSSFLLNSENRKELVEFCFDFEYFNSSSGKLILDICKLLASLRLKGVNIVVKWYFEKEDGDMLEVGQEMSRIVKFPFEYVESDKH